MRALATAAATLLALGAAEAGAAQSVRGALTEERSGAPVADAAVTLISSDGGEAASGRTGENGAFLLSVEEPGGYRIRADKAGYRPGLSTRLQLAAGDTARVAIALAEMVVLLDSVRVEGRAGIPHIARAFYERMASASFGIFISRDDVLASRARRTTDLLRRVPGVRLTPGRGDGFAASLRGGCSPTVYIDGTRALITPGLGIDDLVHPGELEGVEIYRSISEAPPQYQGLNAGCSAILFWTRIGPDPR